MMGAPCWVTRLEALLGTSDLGDVWRLTPAQWAEIDRIAAARLNGQDCGWEGPPRHEEDGGCHSGYCVCRWHVLEALCGRDEGHDGPHAFVDQRDLLVTFAPAAATTPDRAPVRE